MEFRKDECKEIENGLKLSEYYIIQALKNLDENDENTKVLKKRLALINNMQRRLHRELNGTEYYNIDYDKMDKMVVCLFIGGEENSK